MKSLDDFNRVKGFGDNTSMFLLFSLVIPVIFKLFLKIGVIFDLIWDLFNMLQLIANMKNLTVQNEGISGRLQMPPQVNVLL